MGLKGLLLTRSFWIKTGYAFTAGWFLVVLYMTGGDQKHPFFDTIFLVPLGVWIVGIAVARLIRGKSGPRPVDKE